MTDGEQGADLAGLRAHDSLLEADPGSLPVELPRPEAVVESALPIRLIRGGAALTLATLLGGVALVALSAVELISGSLAVAAGALALGVLLAGTHRRWIALSERTAGLLEARRRRALAARRERWLEAIEPYPRYEISTSVGPDGSIEIVRACHCPVRCAGERFRFERAIEHHERYEAEEPSAVLVERAEQLRAEAALDTERARERYLELRDAQTMATLRGVDERARLAALRAASGSLSERINAHLRER